MSPQMSVVLPQCDGPMNAATRIASLIILLATMAWAEEPQGLTISAEPIGDSDSGVVTRVTYRFAIPSDVPHGVSLVIIGSTTQSGAVLKRFRYPLGESQRESISTIQTLQPGDAEVEARLMIPLEEQAPVIVAKTTAHFAIARTNKPYVASA